jgi:Asp-tRNA(Asn)/Glu-tRNA(Gln) amidotransferase A subunit family amidase
MNPYELSIAQAAQEIRARRLESQTLVQACLDRVKAVDGDIGAWAFLDPGHALAEAKARDDYRAEGKELGRLHGVPIAVKDIFDTADMPTEMGSPIHKDRMPRRDAVAVARLRAAGAVVLGKTVTAEFAYFHPGKTRNPHDPKRTPGGSSSGSAAAVAAKMAPGAIGTQTNGSTIRPAAFCGVVGFKPTHGLIPRTGALICSRTLDHVGVFARTVEDAALLAEVMMGQDDGDPDTKPFAVPPLAKLAMEEPPVTPRLAFLKTAAWDQAEKQTHEAFAELVESLGQAAEEIELPSVADEIFAMHRTIMDVEMAVNLDNEYRHAKAQLSPKLQELLERGRKHAAYDYRRALDAIAKINEGVDDVFNEFDVILTPSAPGEAPLGIAATGNPAFSTIWTYLGLPAVTVPVLTGEAGLPMGAQLIARRGYDARALRTAQWLAATLAKNA